MPTTTPSPLLELFAAVPLVPVFDEDDGRVRLLYARSTPLTPARLRGAERSIDREPTEAQKESGNYAKGHVRWKGIPITVETAKGQWRRGKDRAGKPWSVKLKAAYGYIKKTESEADGDHIDVFLGDDLDSEAVFVVNQDRPDGSFDEHKCMIGCQSMEDAKDLYLSNYAGNWKGFGSIVPMTLVEFKRWIGEGDTSRPVESPAPKPGGFPGMAPERLLYARSTPLVSHGGKLVSAHSKAKSSECSTAASQWRTGHTTPDTYKTLARCRAMASGHKQAGLHRAAGSEGKAQALEHRANSGKIGAKRRGDLLREAKAERAKRQAGQGKPEVKAPLSIEHDPLFRVREIAAKGQALTERAKASGRHVALKPTSPAHKEAASKVADVLNARHDLNRAIGEGDTTPGFRSAFGEMIRRKSAAAQPALKAARAEQRGETGPKLAEEPKLPPRTADTMSDAIAMSSPSGSMSNRAREAATERLRTDLFGKEGLRIPKPAQPSEAESLRQKASELRGLAERGMKPRAYKAEAERLEAKAAGLTQATPAPAGSAANPIDVTPRRPAPADRIKHAFEAADRANGGTDFVKISDVHRALPDIPLAELHGHINDLRRAGELTGNSHEGLHGTLTPEEKAAALNHPAEGRLPYLSRREGYRPPQATPSTPGAPAPAPVGTRPPATPKPPAPAPPPTPTAPTRGGPPVVQPWTQRNIESLKARMKNADPADLKTFAAQAMAAVPRVPRGGYFGEDKVFLRDLHRAYQDTHGPIPVERFKARLVEANTARHLDLARADMVEAMDPDQVRESAAHHPLGSEFNFLRVPAGSRPAPYVEPEGHGRLPRTLPKEHTPGRRLGK